MMRVASMARSIALVAAILAITLAAPARAAQQDTAPVPFPTPSAAQSVVKPDNSTTAHPLTSADLAAWLDGFVPYALNSGDIAGGVIAVVKDGKLLLQKGYGYADVARKIPMDPETTMIRPGSTSKLFTWTAVMQLVAAGKLNLDQDVNTYLDFKIPHKGGKAVTLRDLMNHRPGFEEGLKDILATDPDGLESTEQYLKQHPRPMLFTPGTVPAYSNYGAALAGYIVQRISGEPYESYIARRIFQPLGMEHSTFVQPLPKRFQGKVSNGYFTASGPAQPYELIVTRPAGSMTTTAADMTRFMIAQLQLGRFGDQQILPPAIAQRMHNPSESTPPGFARMAHGFFWSRQNGHVVIGHGGDTVVFHTEMDLLPQDGVGIFYSFNSRGKDDAVYLARQALFDSFMNRYFPALSAGARLPTLPTASQDAQEIAGLYQSSRRVEHGFLGLFYLLQQSSITTNADGTITAPAPFTTMGTARFREVGPQLWRQVGGTRELALARVGGVKTVIDSEDPTSVLQGVPPLRSAPLNLTILLGSAVILIWCLLLWPLAALLKAGDHVAGEVSREVRRFRLYMRAAATVDVVYLGAWAVLLQPVLSEQLQFYSYRLDPVVGTLESAGLLAMGAAGVGAWAAWRLFKTDASWLSRIWNAAVAMALLGVVWIGVMGGLMAFNLNY